MQLTPGELVFVLDADHVPMPDALEALVGYFDDDEVAVVQTPHEFYNHDSTQHYEVGRHEQSCSTGHLPRQGPSQRRVLVRVGRVSPPPALLDADGVATETIAEDFHTTIRSNGSGGGPAMTTRRSSRASRRTTWPRTSCSAIAGRAGTSPCSRRRSLPCEPAS